MRLEFPLPERSDICYMWKCSRLGLSSVEGLYLGESFTRLTRLGNVERAFRVHICSRTCTLSTRVLWFV